MITAIKIILMLAIILLLSYPFIRMKGKMKKFSVASSLRYEAPHMRKNIFFVLLSVVEFIVVLLVFKIFDKVASVIVSIPFVGKWLSDAVNSLNSQIDYILFAVKMVLINLIMVYAFIILKAFLKKFIINPMYKLGKKRELFKRNKNKKTAQAEDDAEKKDPQKAEETEEEKVRKRRRIPDFVHTLMSEDEADETDGNATQEKAKEKMVYGPVASFILSKFFEGDEFQYARNWVIRVRMVLQIFIHLVQALYLVFLTTVLLSVFFALPMPLYNLLINVLHIGEWYIYPILSIIFLQEVCNVFDTPLREEKIEDERQEEERNEAKKLDARIRALLAELKRRFDSEHSLRYYPAVSSNDIPQYECTNLAYASSMEYISKLMENSSGRVVQSYMECLDAMYCDSHVYFAASFYSELGEYLIAYTYTRLLSGSRMVFVVSDPNEKETLRTYISDRLMQMTGSSASATWRVYTVDEHLDQADILIASPSDFSKINIAEQHPAFFEEVCNAVFIDADKNISMDSYLCPIMATRLQKATENRIRFVFLSLDLLKGFAERNLPKFFCVDNVLSFSSAKENEAVSYVLWNKESKKHRIYNKSGQKLTCLETIIAEQAFQYGMDGVRLITESPLGHAERQILALHDVEINKLFKKKVDVNYMIYSDDRCNLSAALYACTRFRGRKKSVVHILSKPYLLREYFMAKANIEDYINRSSFIQPRVTEHVEDHKFSLLRVFCEVADEEGLSVSLFEQKMRDIITAQKERKGIVSSAFCRDILRTAEVGSLKTGMLAAYLVAGLCDNDPVNTTPEEEAACIVNSVGNRAKDFYLIIDPAKSDRYALVREKKILFSRVKEVFERLLECNKRVELRLNDEVIGMLDTFPSRVALEYIAGQSIVYDNSEYEIDHIASDGSAIYLRHENISIKNCLDTVLLRHYQIKNITPAETCAVLNNSKSLLEEIRVTKCDLDYVGTTFGFYSLTTDRQTLDFQRGVEGNPHVETPNVRDLTDAKALHVTLKARMACNDGMRLLMTAVFNEFIRTIFPHAYHCVAICPVLEKPYTCEGEDAEDTALNRIRTLYPFLKQPDERFVETDPMSMQFIFINDCLEDVGVLDWFYDRAARYMQEFLANVYSYLHWLKVRPEMNHYIYYGGEALPECFDLAGCCELLSDYNLVLSDDGQKDFETAGDDVSNDVTECCAFCHRPMESGRFSFFDKHRFICADCFEVVDDVETLEEMYNSVKEYLHEHYAEITFGNANVKFDPVHELTSDQLLSEFNHRVDFITRTIYVEIDEPINNVSVALMRGVISLWQADSSLANGYAMAQLYFEELKYLREKGADVSADWIYDHLPDDVRLKVDEIADYVNFKDLETAEDADDAENGENEEKPADQAEETRETGGRGRDLGIGERNGKRRTSFSFMRIKGAESKDEEWDDDALGDEECSDSLYDPNKIPRFWKRYLKGERADNGQEEDIPDDALNLSEEEENTQTMPAPNAPLGVEEKQEDEVEKTDGGDSPVDEKERKKQERQRQKEEKKRQREERRRQKQLDQDPETEDDQTDTPDDTDPVGNDTKDSDGSDGTDGTDGQRQKKAKGGAKKKGSRKKFGRGSVGERMVPYEEDEKTNPKIRLYNDLVRAAYNYEEGEKHKISYEGVSLKDVDRIFKYVQCDYPELFWVSTYNGNSTHVWHRFRCRKANGDFDVKQVNQKRAEIRKAAKPFIKGITRKTDPYEAVLTIYRRLILTLDYDTDGLNAHIDADNSLDDRLRSLHSALVNHKVVCAGYAVAMQYLLQSVGIVCGYVISEDEATKTGRHAFNILKIGKYCYYLDATWGDFSNTSRAGNEDVIIYDYFCVPYDEFILAEPERVPYHIPRKAFYPNLEQFKYTNHEYYRYHNAYIKSYSESELVRIFADAALAYDEEEMGRFVVSFRCRDVALRKHVVNMLSANGKILEITRKAQAVVAKTNKKAAKLFDCDGISPGSDRGTGVAEYYFAPSKKKPKK